MKGRGPRGYAAFFMREPLPFADLDFGLDFDLAARSGRASSSVIVSIASLSGMVAFTLPCLTYGPYFPA